MLQANWDVIIIGGGPAGSSAATTLAKQGKKVLVLEKEKFPRFHIGESLLTYNYEVFDALGVTEKIKEAGFMTKHGAQFWMGNGSRCVKFVFARGSYTHFPTAYQVERSKFDEILLRHSEECGAVVKEESLVTGHEVTEDHVTVRFKDTSGQEREERAAFLMDASGLTNLTANLAGERKYYEGHKKIAVFGHFQQVKMPDGKHEGDILIIRRPNSWFWMIPLSPEKTSVGLVLDKAEFSKMGVRPEEAFAEAVKTTKVLRERMEGAVPHGKLHVLTDFSYKNDSLVSKRLVRIGDAAGFIDPIFSSGVLLAMKSGHKGALAVNKALESGVDVNVAMKRYERETRKHLERFWEFIENFYTTPFSQLFFQPVPKMKIPCAINAVLAGRDPLPIGARLRLRLFFLLVWLQQYVPVVRKIAIR